MPAFVPGPLFCCAHPSEAKTLPSGVPCLVTGVGKVPAAVTLGHYLGSKAPGAISEVFIFGVAGVYPDEDGVFEPMLEVGAPLWVTRDLLADEGVQVPDGFLDLDELKLRGKNPQQYAADSARMEALREILPLPELLGATVSTCSGTDALSLQRVRRYRARVETMEGAALAHCCWVHNIPWVQLRVISNRCGDRAKANWDLPLSLSVLRSSLKQIVERSL